ncbi:hypothetical protein [Sandaracinus amylolyticus]|uniref:hypothetical protein n=1 Tax=Sandaracinus amylolyticus TaxID=927083 RepID=UPI001F1CEE1D|nr:hypothetical protein [Sandaracinus amylolyticus]UJR83187.1 Hypothetical protein I5071_52530 [Sandaracinus amylolyticus]
MRLTDLETVANALGPGAPWRVWLAVCLCRQRARQTWLVEVAAKLAGEDAEVPGAPGWWARHHGIGLCLKGPLGEVVDMDFAADTPRSIDPHFFAHRVEATQRAPEAELRRWLPTQHLVVAALDELLRDGIVEHSASQHTVRLCDVLESAHVHVALLDDETLARAVERMLAGDRAAPSGPAHVAWLSSLLHDRRRSAAVAGIGALVSDETLVHLARGHVDTPDAMSASLLDACTRRGLDVIAVAVELSERLDPAEHHPFVACAVARHLLAFDTGHSAKALAVVHRFAAVERVAGYVGNPMLDQLAFLLLEHAPHDALPVLRRALRGSPACAEDTAELLVALDEPWCHRELESLLRDQGADAANRRRAARALAASSSELARRRARELVPAAPESSRALGFSFDEIDHAVLDREAFAISNAIRALADRLRRRPAPDVPIAE